MKNRKSMFKKTIALVVALVMCAVMLPTAVFATDAENTPDPNGWDGTTTAAIPHVGNTYTISTPEQLAQLAVDVNGGNSYSGKTVVLAADINLNFREFTPIGDWNHPFAGTFDGKKNDTENYTISNAVINGSDETGIIRAGLFGAVRYSGEVKNLVLDHITVTNNSMAGDTDNDETDSAAGIAVATLEAGMVQNVCTTNTCAIEGQFRTGGIVGDIRGKQGTVKECTNEATVTGKNLYTGGIVGAAHSLAITDVNSYGATIDQCTNSGSVTGTSSVGGIVGYSDRAKVTDCHNTASGTIKGTGNYGIGGIMGSNNYNSRRFLIFVYNPTVSSVITGCDNAGTVCAESQGYAGGILGAYVVTPGKDQPNNDLVCTITNCTNTGNIIGPANRCGTIFGYQITYKYGDGENYIDHLIVKFVNCTPGGTVNGSAVNIPSPSPYTEPKPAT